MSPVDEAPGPQGAPFRFSRESRIRIDRDGRFHHEGDPVEHEKLARALASWVAIDEATGRYVLRNSLDWCFVTVDDAPLAVQSLSIDAQGTVTLALSDGTTEALALDTLRVDDEGAAYCDVRDRSIPARFSRAAAFALLEHARPVGGDESRGYELVLGEGHVHAITRVVIGEGARRPDASSAARR